VLKGALQSLVGMQRRCAKSASKSIVPHIFSRSFGLGLSFRDTSLTRGSEEDNKDGPIEGQLKPICTTHGEIYVYFLLGC
jgi:hypothetical protein